MKSGVMWKYRNRFWKINSRAEAVNMTEREAGERICDFEARRELYDNSGSMSGGIQMSEM